MSPVLLLVFVCILPGSQEGVMSKSHEIVFFFFLAEEKYLSYARM